MLHFKSKVEAPQRVAITWLAVSVGVNRGVCVCVSHAQVDNILEATYNSEAGDYEAHTLSIEVQDVPGVLNQVSAHTHTYTQTHTHTHSHVHPAPPRNWAAIHGALAPHERMSWRTRMGTCVFVCLCVCVCVCVCMCR